MHLNFIINFIFIVILIASYVRLEKRNFDFHTRIKNKNFHDILRYRIVLNMNSNEIHKNAI